MSTGGGFTGTASGSITFNLGNTINEQVASASTYGVFAYSNQTTYSQAHLNSTGTLYQTTQYIVLGGLLLGLAAGVLAVLPGNRPGLHKGAIALGIVALLFAIAGPVTLAVAQPAALKHDESRQNATRNMSGPWTSYFGSCASGANCGSFGGANGSAYSESWGPGGGWWVSVFAFVLLLVGVILARRPPAAGAPAQPYSSIPYYAPQQQGYPMPPPGYGTPPPGYQPGPSSPPPPGPMPPPGWPPPSGSG